MTTSVVSGNIHQGSDTFGVKSREKQSVFMCLSAFLQLQQYATEFWTNEILDQIMYYGDAMYLAALHSGSIPNTSSLLVKDLPVMVQFPNGGGTYIITYGDLYEGAFTDLFFSTPTVSVTLTESLRNTFLLSNLALVIFGGYSVALMKSAHRFFLFDSHQCDVEGMPTTNCGTGILLSFTDILELEMHILRLAVRLGTDAYIVTSVKLSLMSSDIQSLSTERRSPENPSQSVSCNKTKSPTSEQVISSHENKRIRLEFTNSERATDQQISINGYTEIPLEFGSPDNATPSSSTNVCNISGEDVENPCKLDKMAYLSQFDVDNGIIHEQPWAKRNMLNFHKSMDLKIHQCKVCCEAWPLHNQTTDLNYVCSRCKRDKKIPAKFSAQNMMIPSAVPDELEGLTQVEQMLIARALPVMRVYVKPGGQRAYKGHCINLPQDITEFANSLPHYPKDIPVIIVKIKGKNNSSRDVTVRREVVHRALQWLLKNNPHYKDLNINHDALNSLPDNGVPSDLGSVETVESNIEDNDPDLGPQNSDEDIIYNSDSEMSTFLPMPEKQKPEIQATRDRLLEQPSSVHWPTVDNRPLSEFLTPFLATMAFPTLFPNGKGDPTNPSLIRDIPFSDRIKHLIKFAEKRDGKWFYRFATHPRFSYWALNMIQRRRALDQSSIYIKQNPGDAHLSVEELQDLANTNDTCHLLSKVYRYASNITGTHAYWHKVRENLKAIITHKGPPTFLFTFSSADMHWPELHSLFHTDSANTDDTDYRSNVINNPHIVDWIFTQRLEKFVKFWLYETLDADWHWYRFEYQAIRGSIHCHGTAKLKNDPGLCQLTEVALKGHLAQKEIETGAQFSPEREQQIQEGIEAARTVCQYTDWLLSTCNPLPPDDNNWVKPAIHPCKRKFIHIPAVDLDSDYVDLINTCQRHTHCSTAYCLRKTNIDSELRCRFKFPFEHCQETRLEFEEVQKKNNSVSYRAKIITKRNDARLNNHQRLQLQGWRANCDIQIIIDYDACAEYMTKYAAKGEPKSPILRQVLNSISHNNTNVQRNTVIKKIMMKCLGERDFSAQETMHHLMSLKLHSSSFNVVPISLDGSRTLCQLNEDGKITKDSLVDTYSKRAQLSNNLIQMNFVQFITNFKVVKGELLNQAQNFVPRIFPTYSSNPSGPNLACIANISCSDLSLGNLIRMMHGEIRTPLMMFSLMPGISFFKLNMLAQMYLTGMID